MAQLTQEQLLILSSLVAIRQHQLRRDLDGPYVDDPEMSDVVAAERKELAALPALAQTLQALYQEVSR